MRYITGIEIGADFIKTAEGREKKNQFFLRNVFKIDFAEPIKNPKGYLIKEEALIGVLRKSNIKNGALLIDGEDIIERKAPMPAASSQNIKHYIQYELEGLMPVDLSEYITDYAVSDTVLRIAAAPKNLINSYINAFKATGTNCLFVDTLQNIAHKKIDLQTIITTCSKGELLNFIPLIKLLYRDLRHV